MNLSINDPSLPGPGELSNNDHRSSLRSSFHTHSPTRLGGSPTIATGDPHHHRTPSLGEIHQELEQEQEAQVNRLLLMIRTQQAQLQQMQQSQQQPVGSGTAVADESTPTSERSFSLPNVPPLPSNQSHRLSFQYPSSLSSRRDSNQPVYPAGLPVGSQPEPGEWGSLSGGDSARRLSRDESSFYQAETAMLTRENQMLRQRIRELERQVSELNASSAHTPAVASNLTASTTAESVPPSTGGQVAQGVAQEEKP